MVKIVIIWMSKLLLFRYTESLGAYIYEIGGYKPYPNPVLRFFVADVGQYLNTL